MFGRDYSDAISLVLYYVDEEYREARPNLLTTMKTEKSSWVKALKIAKENGLLYYFSERLLENGEKLPNNLLERVIEQEKIGFMKLRETLCFVNSLFEDEGLEFMFIKLYRGLPYVPRDVDVLMRRGQSQRVFSALKERGGKLKAFGGVETQCEKEGLLKIDLYEGFYYLSLHFLDEDFLWENPRTVEVCNVKCLIPSCEADFISLIIHALLGHRYLSLLDFLYAKSLFNVDWNFDELLRRARKHGWCHAFLTMVSTIQSIHRELYLESNTTKYVDFPYTFPPKFILKAFNGFAGMPISAKTKFAFVFSTLIDSAFHNYQITQRSVSIEIPNKTKSALMKFIHKVRGWSGDRKMFI